MNQDLQDTPTLVGWQPETSRTAQFPEGTKPFCLSSWALPWVFVKEHFSRSTHGVHPLDPYSTVSPSPQLCSMRCPNAGGRSTSWGVMGWEAGVPLRRSVQLPKPLSFPSEAFTAVLPTSKQLVAT